MLAIDGVNEQILFKKGLALGEVPSFGFESQPSKKSRIKSTLFRQAKAQFIHFLNSEERDSLIFEEEGKYGWRDFTRGEV